ncbi:hypothetical protein MTO96_012182 [Rhipicephalus appendiculatus]
MPSTIAVEGMEVSAEIFDGPGWATAMGSRRQKIPPNEELAARTVEHNTQPKGPRCPKKSQSTLHRVVTASRLPRLPKDQIRVIIRPRGGLDVARVDLVLLARAVNMAAKITDDQAREDTICPNRMQNIIVISTPHQSNAAAYVKVQKLHTNQGAFEVAAYVAAPDNTCKGVIKNVDLSFDDATLKRLIVHDRNPTAIEARRIKQTKVVAILFDGLRVPSTVMCGNAMVPCSLYKRQVDVCRTCGGVGHRADVCRYTNATNQKCHNCGETLQEDAEHQCEPKCKLCSGNHPTGDRECKRRFHIPYIVRRRRRRRKQEQQAQLRQDAPASVTFKEPGQQQGGDPDPEGFPDPEGVPDPVAVLVPEGAPLTRSGSNSRPPSREFCRSRSRTRPAAAPQEQQPNNGSWASRVGGASRSTSSKSTGKAQPEHAPDSRIQALEHENRALRKELEDLRASLARIESGHGISQPSSPTPPTPRKQPTIHNTHKRKAVESDSDTTEEVEMVPSDKEAPLLNREFALTALNDKIDTLANTLANFIETFKNYTEKADQRFASLEKMGADPTAAKTPQNRNADKPMVTANLPNIISRAKVRPVKAHKLAEETNRDAQKLQNQNGH